MRPGRLSIALLSIVLVTAVPGAAETVSEEIGDRAVTVYVLEEDTTHNTVQTDTTTLVYHREERTSGAWVDDQGANATAANTTRTVTHEDGTHSSDRTEESVELAVHGQAAGYTTDQRIEAEVIDRSFDFGEDLNGDTNHVIVSYDGNTYGDGLLVRNDASVNPGAGHLVTPQEGDVYFVNGGPSTDHHVRVEDTTIRAGGGAGHDTFVGDWTGSYVSAGLYEVHCQGFDCQSTSLGESVCLIGYRPPFFLECGL